MKDLTITSLETITAFGITSGEYLFTLDELQNTAINQTQETTDITGKGGRKLATLNRNKDVAITGGNGLVSGGLLEMQTGSKFENKTTTVMWTDYVTSGANCKTTYKAIGTAGAEIVGCYIRNSDGSLGDRSLIQREVASTPGTFAYDPTTRALTFFDNIVDGTEFVVFYERRITADTLENRSDAYSVKCSLYIDALAEDKCGNIYRVQFYIPKASFKGDFNFEMGDNQTVHNFEANVLSGACGTGGTLWTYTVFGADTGDADLTPKLRSIAVTTPPTKTAYSAEETFNPTGMVITATYDNTATEVLNAGAYTYTPNRALTTADTTITISYTVDDITKTATQAITVSA